eukprot:3698792-Pleurochrysis_carterae.AAC.2
MMRVAMPVQARGEADRSRSLRGLMHDESRCVAQKHRAMRSECETKRERYAELQQRLRAASEGRDERTGF